MPSRATIARVILDGFDKHYRLFRDVSAAATQRFEKANWSAGDEANRQRIQMYDERVLETVQRLKSDHPSVQQSGSEWPGIKLAYISLLHQHLQPECAETFFNSVACSVLHRRYYNNAHIFWRPSVATDYLQGQQAPLRSYYPQERGSRRALLDLLTSYSVNLPWRSLRADLRRLEAAMARSMTMALDKPGAPLAWSRTRAAPNRQFQVLATLFYRNKGAYIVGREINGPRQMPFVISLVQNAEGELAIDALITDDRDLALLFSFSRAYFMVNMDVPAAYVAFLRELMPDKPTHEVYSLLGLQKHGKTLFYRELHHHLQFSRDHFRIADGIRGMVMLVFTLPSFPFVFKLIRDRFDPPKTASRQEVRDKYLLVKNHDRIGRLADTLEFSNVALPLDRIDTDLLDHLKRDASMNIEIEKDRLILKHLYIERRMTPLNSYLPEAAGDERERVIRDYGQAIRELAGADIFPGDMMLKNFGVTRHGRVVFYDYDEIVYLHECHFRKVPPTPPWMDDLSSEPWYSVQPDDVFPETFEAYFFSSTTDKALFKKHHEDLTDAAFWQQQQELISSQRRADLYPYPDSARLLD